MRKIITSLAIVFLLLLFTYELLTNSSTIFQIVSFSFEIWIKNIFPSLFPFFIISELLIHYGFAQFLGEMLKPFMQKLFRVRGNGAFVFVMSMISGFPSSAKYAKHLLDKEMITDKEATKLLMFSHFSNPLFILGTVSILFLNNYEIGFLILFCHYISNFLIGIIFRNYMPSEEETTKVSLKQAILAMHKKRMSSRDNFGTVLGRATANSTQTMILILGIVTSFLILTSVIDSNIALATYHQSILNGFVEMTQGLKYISILDIPLKLKAVLSTMILSFGGLSVHMQMMSILSDTKIRYLPFLTARLLHASFASILLYLLFDLYVLFI